MLENNLKLSVSNIGEKRRSIVFGKAHYGPKGICGPRTQPDFQLVLMLKGRARIELKTSPPIDLHELHISLLKPGVEELFLFDPESPVHHSWCSVQPGLLNLDQQTRLFAAPSVLPLSSRMRELIELGLTLPTATTVVAESFMEQLGIAALENYLYEATLKQLLNHQSEAVRRALVYIDQHVSEPITLEDLSQAAYLSKQHLIRTFTKELGTTPSRYLWSFRTRKGVDLLRETGIPISEIAAQLGFQSPFHFSRLVKEAHGVSPRALRIKAWQFRD